MRFFLVKGAKQKQRLLGEITLPGDKSIACRSIIISAISQGNTAIENFPSNEDCLYALKAFQKLGIKIAQNSKAITVFGKGLYGLERPKGPIFMGDSGTTFRLTLGVLAGQNFSVTLTAGKSLSLRPMLRVTAPLRMMGAIIKSPPEACPPSAEKVEEYPPITIKGGNLKAITYKMPIASAQVKSAILLAGLYAKGTTEVIEPVQTRDHTERMLRLFGADIRFKESTCAKSKNRIIIKGNKELVSPGIMSIPPDISSASFLIVLATILPGSKILIRNVGLNPSRIGIIRVLRRMGADIEVKSPCQQAGKFKSYEPIGDIVVKSSRLKGTTIKKEQIPSLIDELPILMVAACNAKGKSIFEGIGELRVKETDRIRSMSENLRKMGADIVVFKTAKSEKIIIQGVRYLKGTRVRSFGDHRTAMSMVVAGLGAQGVTRIGDISCINKSFPEFLSLLETLLK